MKTVTINNQHLESCTRFLENAGFSVKSIESKENISYITFLHTEEAQEFASIYSEFCEL